MTQMCLPDYNEISASLIEMKIEASAAEMHGMLSGAVCAGMQMNGNSWMDFIQGLMDDEDAYNQTCEKTLIDLFEVTKAALQSDDFVFQLLLPADDEELGGRALSLSEWCQGFLYGLGLAGASLRETETEDSTDALFHISEIAKLDFEAINSSDEDEQSFEEVCEYIRMAVIMLYTEWHQREEDGVATSHDERVLH